MLKETERQRREFAARYAFMTLDTDGDGYVSIEQVGGGGRGLCKATVCVCVWGGQLWMLLQSPVLQLKGPMAWCIPIFQQEIDAS